MGVDSTILGMACVLVGIIGKLADTFTSKQMEIRSLNVTQCVLGFIRIKG